MASVTLRDVLETDILTLHRQQSDPLAVEMAQVPPRDEAAYVAHWQALLADDTVGKKVVLVDGVVAGQVISFTRNGVCELGYWIDRAFWGRGIAGAAVREYLTIERRRPLFAVVAEHNAASRRILERAGFRQIGRRDGALRYELTVETQSSPDPTWSGPVV